VIAAAENGYAIVTRKGAELIYQREGQVVSDHGRDKSTAPSEDDEYYAKFEVPDDLIW